MEKVYFCRKITAEAVWHLYEKVKFSEPGKIGVKLHFGEQGNRNFLDPKLTTRLMQETKADFVETNVLYLGKRHDTENHLQLAKEHGFDFAPIKILDAEGDFFEQHSGYKHFSEVRLPLRINDYDSFVIYSHFKGHILSGFGGAIKNVGMGMASVAGKMAQHASTVPVIKKEKCINCGLCLQSCPADAIILNPVTISPELCIGCGKCIGCCPQRVFNIPWASLTSHEFQERLVEYASMISTSRKMIYINVIDKVSALCDCDKDAPEPFLNDVGILASHDMLAIDQASCDLVNKAMDLEDSFAEKTGTSGKHSLDYSAQIGLGNRQYELMEII